MKDPVKNAIASPLISYFLYRIKNNNILIDILKILERAGITNLPST